eukprot:5850719-Prymnesium_polylepis.1
MQPAAVKDALGKGWRELPDALPVSVHVEEEGDASKEVLPTMSAVGSTRQLYFAPSSRALTIKIAEGSVGPKGEKLRSPL